ncbi:MAG: hypothetical protein IJM57_02990 [Lachnospiraceae bacterium]|nr:hypothetical protein [Lachnospiraceae bacterium]
MMGITGRFQTDAGTPRGRQFPIACGVWFTSTGRLIPLSVKWKGDDGSLHMLNGIRVLSVTDKNYCGIPSTEYDCETEYCGARIFFRLLYYAARREWKLLWPESDAENSSEASPKAIE